MTATLTSAHWPEGAQFLQSLYRCADILSSHAIERNKGRTIGTIKAVPMISEAGHTTILTDVDIPAGPHITSAHMRLPIQSFLGTARDTAPGFVRQGAALPGLLPYARLPAFDLKIIGHGPNGGLTGHIGLVGQGISLTGAFSSSKDHSQITPQSPFLDRAQDLLNCVDILCDRAPVPDAPAWIAMYAAGEKRSRMERLGGPYLANSEEDAVTIAPILAVNWRIPPENLLVFQAPQRPTLALQPRLSIR